MLSSWKSVRNWKDGGFACLGRDLVSGVYLLFCVKGPQFPFEDGLLFLRKCYWKWLCVPAWRLGRDSPSHLHVIVSSSSQVSWRLHFSSPQPQHTYAGAPLPFDGEQLLAPRPHLSPFILSYILKVSQIFILSNFNALGLDLNPLPVPADFLSSSFKAFFLPWC